MPALAPVITQTAPNDQPATAGSVVATLATDPTEVDPGPFTYDVSSGTGFSTSGTDLIADTDLEGDNAVGVTVTGSDATASPEATATISLGTAEPPPPEAPEDPYEDNANIPAPLPPGTEVLPWSTFLVMATTMVRPLARNGVDFVVARPSKDEENQNVFWDDEVLGARPDAEIQAVAEELAAQNPYYLPTEEPAMVDDETRQERDPKAWQNFVVLAINGMYPRLRNGLDWAVGRKEEDGDIELLEGEENGVDWGKVQEAAQKLADADPYSDYQPKPGLAPVQQSGRDQGEQHVDPSYDGERKGLRVEPAGQGGPLPPRMNHPPGPPPETPPDPNAQRDY